MIKSQLLPTAFVGWDGSAPERISEREQTPE